MEREKHIMARETEFAQQTGERAMQAAAVGFTWSREFAEESFTQGKRTLDAMMRITRKMAEDFESQCSAIREQTAAVTEKTLSNTMEYGQKLARVKEPQEFAQCQSEFLARQAQTLADQTKEFGLRMQKAAQTFASNASNAMAEASRRTEDTVSTITSRAADQSKRHRAEA
jgi:C1A family cysteine protease